MGKIKSYSLRVEESLLKKFHYVAKYNGRSVNAQILMYIRKSINKFEEIYGPIELNDEQSPQK